MSRAELAERMPGQERYNRLFALAGDLLCVNNADGYFVQVNPAFTATLGWTAEELLSRPILDFVHPDDRAATGAEGARYRDGMPTRQFENRYQHKDGSWRWLSWNATPVAAEGLTYAVARDVTAQKRSAEALRQSEARFRLLFSEAPTGMALAASDGRLLEVNPALCQMLGYAAHELLEQGTPLLTHPDDLPASRALIDRLLAGASQSAILEKRYLHRNGYSVWTHYTATLLRDDVGQPHYFIFHLHDITARKQAEEAKARLAAIVEASDDAIFGKSLDGVVTAWNGGAERLYGYGAAEMLGQTVARLVPPERPDELDTIMRAVARGETIRQYETERLRRDGRRVAAALTIAPIRDQGGAVTGAAVVARDITARKAAEAALHTSEAHLRQVEEHAPIGLALVAPDGRWLRVNPALCALVGYDEAELLARTFQDITHPDDLDADLGYVQQMLAGEIATYQMEKRYVRKDGTPVWVLLSVSLVRDAAGQPLYFISQIQDIDARKRTEESLREREARYRLLAENATDLISRHTPDGAYLYASPVCESLLGYTADELTRQAAYVRFHPDDIPAVRASHAQCLLGEQPAIVAYRLRHKDGHYLWVETTSRAVRDPHTGAVREIQCATRDISERRKIEAELAEARETALAALREKAALAEARQAELERSNRELQQFASVVAHDLRTPLASIHGYADLLRLLYSDRENAEAMECLDYILTASARMNGLMADILAYARAGGALGAATLVDCAAAAREARSSLRGISAGCEAEIRCGDLPVVRGHAAQITQLFQNLIGNALKFRHPGRAPRVTVTSRADGDWWRISVADNGIGLDPADAERIFGVFERAHARAGYEGTGLGLAICARIAERHGGRIWVESAPGAGATFHVILPRLDSNSIASTT